MAASPTTRTARAGRKEEKMTKYYFISYIYQNKTQLSYSCCLFKAHDITLNGMAEMIAESRGISDPKQVVILSMKDLTKKEYEMLKGGSHGED